VRVVRSHACSHTHVSSSWAPHPCTHSGCVQNQGRALAQPHTHSCECGSRAPRPHTHPCVCRNRVVHLHTRAHTRAEYRRCVSRPCARSLICASTGQHALAHACAAAGRYAGTPARIRTMCAHQQGGMPLHTRLCAHKQVDAIAHPCTHSCVPAAGSHSLHTRLLCAEAGRRVCTSLHTLMLCTAAGRGPRTRMCTAAGCLPLCGSCGCTLAHTRMCAAAGHRALARTQVVCRIRGVRWRNLTPTHVSAACAGHHVLTHTHVYAETGWYTR
jgi:hypothetical protein